jgi:hypothetical protein
MQSHRLALASVVFVVACHHASSSETVPGSPKGPSNQPPPGAEGASAIRDKEIDACKALWTPLCSAIASCESVAFTSQFGSQDECVAAFALSCATGSFGPESGATPENVTQCAGALDVSSCDKLAAYGQGKAPASCLPPGKKADGAACLVPTECSGGVCAQGSGNLCGACATAVTVVGGKCGDRSGCVGGLFCKSDSSTCEQAGARGGSCDAKDPCAPPLACISGTCGDPTATGGSCDPTAPTCASDAACNATSKTCQLVQTVKLGATCGQIADGSIAVCEHGTRCRSGKTSTDPATCVASIPLGGACTTDYLFGSGCDAPASCIKGQCVVPTPAMCQ